jgi:FixJ family two-component response regulator
MQTISQNLFLLYDNLLTANRIVDFLDKRFSNSLKIAIYSDGETLLKEVDDNTAIVVVDYDLKKESIEALLIAIKKANPKTEIIILSTVEDVAIAIEVFRKGAKTLIIKGEKAPRALFSVIYKILNYPVNILTERFGINKILAIFITYFLFIGIVVYIGMLVLHKLE